MPNVWVPQERLNHFKPLIEDFATEHPFPTELNKWASGWKDHDWMTECAMNLEVSVDYLRKILIGMEWITPKRKNSPVKKEDVPNVLIADADGTWLILERNSRGGFKVIRDCGVNRLAAESFIAGYQFALRNYTQLLGQGD